MLGSLLGRVIGQIGNWSILGGLMALLRRRGGDGDRDKGAGGDGDGGAGNGTGKGAAAENVAAARAGTGETGEEKSSSHERQQGQVSNKMRGTDGVGKEDPPAPVILHDWASACGVVAGAYGRAVQIEMIGSVLKPPGTKSLKLK
jgi:hypothetical protein